MWVDFGAERDSALRDRRPALDATRSSSRSSSPDETRGHVRRSHLREGRRRCCACSSSTSARTVFRDAIRQLPAHATATPTPVTTDLWDALEEVSGHPVRDMMNTWILQGGHPLVTLEDGHLRQQPFAYGPARGASAIGSSWMVPVLDPLAQRGPPAGTCWATSPDRVTDAPPVVRQRRRLGRLPLALRVAAELAALAGRRRRARASSSAPRSSPTSWALLFSEPGHVGPSSSPSPRASATRTSRPRGRPSPPRSSYVNRALRDEQRDGLAAHRARARSNRSSRDSAGTPRPGESELTPQMRAIVLGDPRNHRRRRGHPRRGRATLRGQRPRGRPRQRHPAHRGRPRPAAATTSTFLDRYRHAATPRRSSATCAAWRASARSAWRSTRPTKCFSEFRNQDAPSILGILSGNRRSRPEPSGAT